MCHVDVTNIGPVEGKAVVQLYVADKTDYEYRPPKELRAFKKVNLKPDEKKTVDLTLNKRSFAFWNTKIHDWYVPTGDYEILIGESSRDIHLTGKVHVESTRGIVKLVSLNSTYEDVFDNPVTRPVIDKLLSKYLDMKKTIEANDPEHEFFRICVGTFPLRSQYMFFPIKGDDILDLIKEANELIQK